MKILFIGAKQFTNKETDKHTICPRSSDPFYIVTYYMKWVTTSWTHSTNEKTNK